MLKNICLTAAMTAMSLMGLGAIAHAQSMHVPMSYLEPNGAQHSIGQVEFTDSQYGLLISPQLKNLTPGMHGFHVHQTPDCHQQGMAAGGHFDPKNTGKHLGPYDVMGHQGDLPVLVVNEKGEATGVWLAPKLRVDDLRGHALIIHAGGDNYSDQPQPLGGGGARIACGVMLNQS